ncbi:MAG: InlB B-repeat-containing protein [Peptococcales bacterium]
MRRKFLAIFLCCVMLMQLFSGVTQAASLCIEDPSIAYDSKKDQYLLAYTYQEDSPGSDLKQVIRYVMVNSDGSRGEELEASENTKFQRRTPQVAFARNSEKYLVTWWEKDRGIVGQIIDSDGNLPGGLNNFTISTSGTNHQIAYDSENDRFLVVWQESVSSWDQGNLYGQIVNPDGTFFGGKIEIMKRSRSQVDSAVEYDSINKKFLITWRDDRTSENKYDLFGKFINPDGTQHAPEFKISDYKISNWGEFYYQEDLDLEFDDKNGQFLLTWSGRPGYQYGDYKIFGRLLQLDKDYTIDDRFLISEVKGKSLYRPSAVFEKEQNKFLVVMDQDENTNIDILGQFIDATGNLIGTTFSIVKTPFYEYWAKLVPTSTPGQYLLAHNQGTSKGTWSKRIGTIFVSNPDTQPPVWPEGSELTISNLTNNSLTLNWEQAQDNVKINLYEIYQDGTPIRNAIVMGDVTSYDVTGLVEGQEYTFSIKTCDAAGNWSADGPSIIVKVVATTTFTVTFDKNGGETEADPTTKAVIGGEVVGALPTEPTRTGYTFGGWNTQADGSGTAFTVDTPVIRDITVYAQWTEIPPVTYTVTYDGNGGTGDPPIESDKRVGKTFAAAANCFIAPSGKQFKEWNTNADGTGEGYAPGADVTMPDGNLTLYAIWEDIPANPSLNPTSVKYDPADPTDVTTFINWGSSAKTVTDVVYGSESLIRGTQYKTDENSLTIIKDYLISLDMTEGKTVAFAVYFDDTNRSILNFMVTAGEIPSTVYTVTFNKNGGDTEADPTIKTVVSDETVDTLPMEPTRAGYTFSGWNTQADGSGTAFTVDTPVTGDITVYALWTEVPPATYSLTITAGTGGSITTGISGNYKADEVVNIKATPNSNYLFNGWTTSNGGTFADASSASTTFTMPPNPTTIMATFKYNGGGDSSSGSSTPKTVESVKEENSNGVITIKNPDTGNKSSKNTLIPYYLKEGREIIVKYSIMENGQIQFVGDKATEYLYKDNSKSFSDIENHWAREDIDFVAARELLGGIGDGMFSPDTSMTRGMMVTVLGRLWKADFEGITTSRFTDISIDSYYAPYVEWAAQNGIVHGIGDNLFAPDRAITREEMAVILANFVEFSGLKLTEVNKTPILFLDESIIYPWAKDSVTFMQKAGILSGKLNNLFDPKGTATRAEVSAVLKRFITNIVK